MSGNNLPRGNLFQDGFLRLNYLFRNNLPRISLIRGNLFLDRYLHPIPAC